MLPHFELSLSVMLILAIGAVPLLWVRGARLLLGVIVVIALTQLYFAWHLLFGALVTPDAVQTSAPLTLWVCAIFAVLFSVQVWLRAYPQGRFAQKLYPWVYYGFYLDERFTRITFRVWPVRIQHAVDPRYLHTKTHNPWPGESA
jgi:NAD(P)H-quinone oxidoreductase subunit 5